MLRMMGRPADFAEKLTGLGFDREPSGSACGRTRKAEDSERCPQPLCHHGELRNPDEEHPQTRREAEKITGHGQGGFGPWKAPLLLILAEVAVLSAPSSEAASSMRMTIRHSGLRTSRD